MHNRITSLLRNNPHRIFTTQNIVTFGIKMHWYGVNGDRYSAEQIERGVMAAWRKSKVIQRSKGTRGEWLFQYNYDAAKLEMDGFVREVVGVSLVEFIQVARRAAAEKLLEDGQELLRKLDSVHRAERENCVRFIDDQLKALGFRLG